ncbi:hypothetical protein BOX15_Mlig016051g1 [Macrostomum lignano]|uniref:SWI/SNF-related matrix-associated actin-dependent regulator of chromatin subfamily A-like protein 1 n=2 Tax=Macrostomum lignano TaxID=282301 RepID=A0A267H806_9PLAT|nr:hypothetical protein BOX15_Mlig016051g1 [Macrostomum lignano]
MQPQRGRGQPGHQCQQKQPTPKLEGKVVLLNENQFEVKIGYHMGLLQLFKSVPSRNYDPATRRWSFHARDYDTFMRLLRDADPSLKRELKIEPLPPVIASILARRYRPAQPQHNPPQSSASAAQQSKAQSPAIPDLAQLGSVIGSDLANSLLPFQVRGVQFVISKFGRALIGDDMGLGKTVQAIAVALYYRANDWPALIVAPSSVRYAWRSQMLRWAGQALLEEDILVLDNSKALTSQSCHVPITIVSYDLLSRCADQLASRSYSTIIFDESHFLKNPKAARSKAAVRVTKNARRLLLLSGTPALSRPAELYTQMSMIRPRLFPGGFHEFGQRYCDPKQRAWGTDYSGSSNMPELQLLLEDSLMIRRLKSDVLDQLPAKRRQMVVLDPTSLKRRESLSGLAKNVEQSANENRSAAEKRGLLLEYFHGTARVKVSAVKQYILDLLEASETRKFLVFAHHSEFLDELDSMLADKSVDRIRIDGRTQPEARHAFAEAFQTRANVRVALLSITAAGTGVNLTAASLVVFGELFWNPGILLQAEDRAYRIGQQNSVCVHYLVAQGTADDHLWPLVQRKLAVLGSAGLNRETFRDAETAYLHLSADKQACITDFYQAMVDEDEANKALFESENGVPHQAAADAETEGDHSEQQEPLAKRYKRTEIKKRKEQLQLAHFFGPSAASVASPAASASAAAGSSSSRLNVASNSAKAQQQTQNDDEVDVEALLAGIPDEEWDFDWKG